MSYVLNNHHASLSISVLRLHLLLCVVIYFCFFFNDTATTEIYTYGHTLSLHDALPISRPWRPHGPPRLAPGDRRPGLADPPLRRLLTGRSEEHTSELQSLMRISYAVFCLKKKQEDKT